MASPRAILDQLARLSPQELERAIADIEVDDAVELRRVWETLLDFIPRVSPELQAPRHLQPLAEVFELAFEQPQRCVISTPPQHGKTSLCLHALVKALERIPHKRHPYVTYEAERAQKLSVKGQEIASAAGIAWEGNRRSWRTSAGGSVFATGVDSGFTGEPVDGLLIVDDPVKDVVEANSATYRERADDWIRGVAQSRIHPSASLIVVQTRWHPDDLAGRLIARGWPKIALPAISDEQGNPADEGKALWPEQRPISFLLEQKPAVGPWVWASLWQTQPRAKGATVFGDVHLYDPKTTNLNGRKVALGADGAYSAKTYSDYSVGLVLAELGGIFYLLDVDRAQIKAPLFKGRLEALKAKHSVTRSRWYVATTEIGTADLLGVSAIIAAARGDKHGRAQPVAAAWNAGKVLCPAGAPWLADFVAEVCNFTGVDDLHDDQVDALAAAYDVLASGAPTYKDLPKIHVPRRF